MTPRRTAQALVVALVSLLLLAPAASAQIVDIPEPKNKIGERDNWTFLATKGLMAIAALVLVATAVGYVVKSREFRANAKRGGSK
jgi:heme/copper-type cytochrome/quinol oxidase subunit 2